LPPAAPAADGLQPAPAAPRRCIPGRVIARTAVHLLRADNLPLPLLWLTIFQTEGLIIQQQFKVV
jgi:hypothetical protein